MSAKDTIDWFDQALMVPPFVAGDSPRVLFRCKLCAALVEGSHRAAHRYWHLGLTGEDVTPRHPDRPMTDEELEQLGEDRRDAVDDDQADWLADDAQLR